jgi:hypothetical protein
MKQPKWLESIEAIDHWEPGYWVARGWDREALMKTTSFIDAVQPLAASGPGTARLAVGGMAHAGGRGISKVELRLDENAWTAAALRDALSPTAWVVWRSELSVPHGHHTLTVRCYDGTGAVQPPEPEPPHPSGASGWQKRQA